MRCAVSMRSACATEGRVRICSDCQWQSFVWSLALVSHGCSGSDPLHLVCNAYGSVNDSQNASSNVDVSSRCCQDDFKMLRGGAKILQKRHKMILTHVGMLGGGRHLNLPDNKVKQLFNLIFRLKPIRFQESSRSSKLEDNQVSWISNQTAYATCHCFVWGVRHLFQCGANRSP